MSKTTPTTPNAFKWSIRIAVGAVVLAIMLGGLVAQRTVLTEMALLAGLKSQGFADAKLRVTGLNWHGIQIEEIHIGDELSLHALNVSYNAPQLIWLQVLAVEIVGLELNISDFDTGLMAVVRQKLTATGSADEGKSAPLPRILLRDGAIHLRQGDNVLSAKISGELQSDGSASLSLSSGHVTASGLPPLDISGQATFEDARGNVELMATPGKNLPPIVVKATFDGDTKRAAFEVSALNFTLDGLQPSDFVLALANLGPVTGTFEGGGEVTLSPAGPTLAARLRMSGAGFRGEGFNVNDGAGVTTIELGAGESMVHLHVQHGQAALGTSQGQRARLSDLDVHAEVNLDTLNLSAKLDNLKVEHPWIKPLNFTGQGARSGNRVNFHLQAQDNLLSTTGHHNLATGEGAGNVVVGPWRFASNGLQPKQLSPLLSAIDEARGTFGATVAAQWGGENVGTASLDLHDLTLKANSVSVEGLNANLNFSHLAPLVTDGVQAVEAKRIGGVVELLKPSVQFRFDSEGRLSIAHAQSGIAGGVMAVDNQVIDFHKPKHPVTVAFSHLDLASLFGLLNVEGVSGTGLLSGSIPLIISADTVTVADGQFAAAGPGVLRVRSEAARNALGGAGPDAVMLLDVLNDFHYQRLELKIDKNAESEASILLSTAGSNPAVMDDQPFVLNINMSTKLDKLLAVLSTALSLSQRALSDTLPSFQ